MNLARKIQSAVIATALILTPIVGSTSASAKNHKPTLAQIEAAKKAELAKKKVADAALQKLNKAKGNLKALTVIANVATAKYSSAKVELQRSTAKADEANRIALEAAASVASTHKEIGKLAINAYMSGGGLSDFESILSASGPQEVMDRLSTLENLGSGNKTTLTRFRAAEQVAQAARKVAEIAREEQRLVTIKVAEAKKEADDAEVEQQKEVDKLQTVQDQLAKDLASAKKVRITLEQKRQLAILEETRANEATKVTGQSRVWETGGPTGAKTFRTTEAQRLKAVDFAKRQVLSGKPYVWGDEGPNSFDCSGLVYAAYKSAGLGWPIWDRLNSGLYYTYTKQIPLSEMQPGDLIFYSYKGTISTIHHMSIYAGNEMVWEARSTKSGLRYSNMYGMPGMMPYAGRV
jgi:cell wall-associated NlpC family hydrolase